MRTHAKQKQAGKSRQRSAVGSLNTQTTLRLPTKLYEQARIFVEQGKTRSVNDFIVNALATYVKAMERRVIDDAFRPMTDDKNYHTESLKIAEQFAVSDNEALAISEKELVGR